jgi:HSP20 family protein
MNLIPWRNKRENKDAETAEQHPLARLRSELDNAFERIWHDPWGASLGDLFTSSPDWGLRLNLAESDNDVTVTAELPGVDPRDVDISVSGNVLTIRGEKKEETEDKRKNYHYVERSYGSFHRSVQLPSYVDPSKVDATYKNGVLTVTLGKHAEAKLRRIAVKHS